jgi:putative membrane protein
LTDCEDRTQTSPDVLVFSADLPQKKAQAPSPLAVLNHRYAAGEIDREEFERMKKELRE